MIESDNVLGAHLAVRELYARGRRRIGIINAESVHENAFTPDDERLLLTFAHQLATAIEKLRLFAQVQERATELAVALEHLQELDHLKNVFIQNTSHELRTPLAIIRGYTDLLKTGDLGALNSPQKESINIISRRTTMRWPGLSAGRVVGVKAHSTSVGAGVRKATSAVGMKRW